MKDRPVSDDETLDALADWEVRGEEADKFFDKTSWGRTSMAKYENAKRRARARHAAKNFDLEPRTTMTDADVRGRLLKHFYELRNKNDGWVPTSEIILSPEQVSRQAIALVCEHMADVGWISWNPLTGGNEGFNIGRGKILGRGVDVVNGHRVPDLDIRLPQGVQLRRDPDLIHKLLLKLEEYPGRPSDVFVFTGEEPELAIAGYSDEQITYHLQQLKEMGLIDSPGSQPMLGVTFRGLSSRGHDVLERNRSASTSVVSSRSPAAAERNHEADRRHAIERLRRRVTELQAFEPMSVQTRRSPEVVKLETAIEDTLRAVFGNNTSRYRLYRSAADLEPPAVLSHTPDWIAARGGGFAGVRENLYELRMQITERKQRAVVLLEQAVQALEEEFVPERGAPAEQAAPGSDGEMPAKALVEIREAIADIKSQLPRVVTSNVVKAEIESDVI